MIKVVGLLKRREGMSFEDFKKYYEEHHAVLARKFLTSTVRYQRRFLKATGGPLDYENAGDTYDCITELWYEDEAAMKADFARLADPETAALIAADEAKLLDRSRIRAYMIEDECPAL